MKKLIGIAFITFLSFGQLRIVNAFPVNLDSSRVAILNLPNDSIKVIKLADLAKKYTKNQTDTAKKLINNALILSEKLGYNYGYAYSLKQKGRVYRYCSQYDSALIFYKKSLEYFEKLGNDSEKARILNGMGNTYKRKGDFNQAIRSFTNSLDISKQIKDTTMISALYNNIALLYYRMDQKYEMALEYHKLNLELLKKINDKNPIFNCLMNLGNVYKRMNNYEMALDYYRQSLEFLEADGNLYDKALLLHNMGTLYERMNKYDLALRNYNKAVKLCKEIGNHDLLLIGLQGIGNVLIAKGSLREGEKYLHESYEIAKEIGNLSKQSSILLNLRRLYVKTGDYKKGYEYLELYDEIEDSLYNIEYVKQVTLLEQKYEAEKRQQQIAFLEKENEIQKLELENKEIENTQKSFQRNVLIIAVFIALLFTIYYALNSKKRKKINTLLLKQNKKIIDQRTEITEQNEELLDSNKTKDKLFQIIAHDLRSPLVSMDSITQLIPYWVEEQDYESLRKLSKTLELSVNNVLSLIDNLLNWALSQQGKFPYQPENLILKENIVEAIEVYKPIAEIKNIDLKLTYTKNVRVFADKNMLFTVLRNLLNNAIKFTPEFGKITVGIDSNTQYAKVWVKDSGVGIPKEKKEEVFELANGHSKGTRGETGKGLGLFFCKEFVSMNNGDIFIESQEGKGTKISFTLPLFNLAEN